jgi:hypothetical protein
MADSNAQLSLPEQSPLWVFAIDSALESDVHGTFIEIVKSGLAEWNSHGASLGSCVVLESGLFLVVAVDDPSAHVSGCAKDSLQKAVNEAVTQFGKSLAPIGNVFFQDPTGEVIQCTRKEFSRLAELGSVSAETIVFNPAVSSVAEFSERFKVAVKDSWQNSLLK